jgi:hypothetical protein
MLENLGFDSRYAGGIAGMTTSLWADSDDRLSARGCRQSAGTLLPAFPGDFSTAVWKVKHKLGMRRLDVNEMDRTNPKRRVALPLGQLPPSGRRVVRKTKGGDQRQQSLVGHRPKISV